MAFILSSSFREFGLACMYTQPIQIFGDESHFQGSITYALVIVPCTLLSEVDAAIVQVKKRYDVTPDASIHCSILFNEEKKAKSACAHLNFEALISLLADLTLESYLAGARGWIGYLEATNAPDQMQFESQEVPGGVDTFDTSSIKVRTVFASQAAMAPITHFIEPQKIQAWIDHEETKISLFGQRRKRVDQLVRFFPVIHNDLVFEPVPVSENKPKFLEIADVLAYAASHALYKGAYNKKQRFAQIVNCMQPGFSEVLFNVPDRGAMGAVRAFDREDRIKNYLIPFTKTT